MSEVEDVVTEAKAGFDLETRLQRRTMRDDTITIFTDEVAGEKLGFAKDVDEKNIFGVVTGKKRSRSGVLGRIDELDPEKDAAAIKKLQKEAAALRAQLKATSIDFKLRAVPTIVIDDCRRKAKIDTGIKGKGIPEDKEEDFNKSHTAHVLTQVVSSYTDAESGTTSGILTLKDAKALGSYLPPYEFLRLNTTVSNLQYKNSIDESVTAQADF